jgi:hypothetical protein
MTITPNSIRKIRIAPDRYGLMSPKTKTRFVVRAGLHRNPADEMTSRFWDRVLADTDISELRTIKLNCS